MTQTARTIDALVKYFYNTSPVKIFEAIYGTGHHDSYVGEKCSIIRRGPMAIWGELDRDNQEKLARIIDERMLDNEYI